jgi:hypothetical protein
VKTWIKSTHTRRVTVEEDRDGPKPSQRAADSLTAVSAFALQLKASCTYSTSWQLVNFAETTSICRHVVRSIFICVFLESDISSRAFADTLANLLMPTTRTSLNDTVTPCVMYAYPFKIGKAPAKGDVYGLLQVCKYPDKTKRGKLKLSTEEFASTQVAQQHINGTFTQKPMARPTLFKIPAGKRTSETMMIIGVCLGQVCPPRAMICRTTTT